VEQFAAEHFMVITALLERAGAQFRNKANPELKASPDNRVSLENDLRFIERDCKKLSLVHTADAVFDFRNNLLAVKHDAFQFTYHEIHLKLNEISDSLRREMKRNLFLFIPSERAKWYQEPLKDWEAVTARFPKTIHDIEEAAKCFACDRFDGAVVHMMLVAEYGALEVGNLLELNDPKLGWPRVSKELKRITSADFSKLSPLEQKHFPLLEQISPLILAMQNAWRHKVSHADNRLVLLSGEFQPFVAEEIIFATRAFMRRLATDLPTI